jgi:hypothetical protein
MCHMNGMKICDSMKLDVPKLGFCCVVFDLARTDFMVIFRVIPEIFLCKLIDMGYETWGIENR